MPRKVQVNRTARTTGIETEGPSAGQLVVGTPDHPINLWAVDGNGIRKRRCSQIHHDQEVKVRERMTGPGGEVLYLIVSTAHAGIRGWVTERFLVFEDEADAKPPI